MRNFDDSFDFDYLGFTFRAYVVADDDNPRPWEKCDGHGPVREVSKDWNGHLQKRPGERPLYVGGRNEYSWVYDWQEAMREALRDAWGAEGGQKPGETRRAYAARAVAADFDFLRAWCADRWHYVGVCVTRIDDEGEETDDPYAYALWGIESNAGEYLREVAQEQAHEALGDAGLLPEQRRAAWRAALTEARERKHWAARGTVTAGACHA